MYTTEFVVTLIEEFWEVYQTSIFLLVFIPFSFYAIACIVYFSLYYEPDKINSGEDSLVKWALKVWIYIITLYMFSFEVFQIIDKGLMDYLSELSNWSDQLSTFLILYLLIGEDFLRDNSSQITEQHNLTFAVIAVMMTWFKVFYWMRLFNNFAFFMNLLSKTFNDKNFISFMAMLIILTLGAANMVYIFNKKRGEYYEEYEAWNDKNVVN